MYYVPFCSLLPKQTCLTFFMGKNLFSLPLYSQSLRNTTNPNYNQRIIFCALHRVDTTENLFATALHFFFVVVVYLTILNTIRIFRF